LREAVTVDDELPPDAREQRRLAAQSQAAHFQ
jgi:hypothetical protein